EHPQAPARACCMPGPRAVRIASSLCSWWCYHPSSNLIDVADCLGAGHEAPVSALAFPTHPVGIPELLSDAANRRGGLIEPMAEIMTPHLDNARDWAGSCLFRTEGKCPDDFLVAQHHKQEDVA